MFIEREQSHARRLLLLDMVWVAAAFLLAFFLRFEHLRLFSPVTQHTAAHLLLGCVSVLAWALALRLLDLYNMTRFQRPAATLLRLIVAGLAAVLAVAAALFLFQAKEASRLVLGLTFAFSTAGLWSSRLAAWALVGRRARSKQQQVLIVGTGSIALRLGQRLERHTELGCKLLGYVAVEGDDADEGGAPPERVVGDAAQIRALLDERVVDQVAIAVPASAMPVIDSVVDACEEVGVDVTLVVQFFDRLITRASLDRVHDMPLVHLHTTPEFRTVLGTKRIFDVIGALLLLPITAPLMLVIAVAIKLTSRGPAVFAQQRLGLHGRRFTMYKFRTMVDNAEQLRGALVDQNEMDGPVFKIRSDPRVTPLGQLLRRYSADELPQLYNVLRGDMSLVGPRPPLAEEVTSYDRWQRRRLSVKPGLTCTWQVSGRTELDFEEWMRLDLEYITNWSPWLDIKLLLRTIPAVLSGRGAS